MLTPVVSLPVPEVVGTISQLEQSHLSTAQVTRIRRGDIDETYLPAYNGFRGTITGFPSPIGALTYFRSGASGSHKYKFAALAVSITDPPPTAMKASKLMVLTKFVASSKLEKI